MRHRFDSSKNTGDGTHGGDNTHPHPTFDTSRSTLPTETPKSERLPGFAEKAMQQALNRNDVQVKSDGKGKLEFLKNDGSQARVPLDLKALEKSNPERYHQIQHNMLKQGIAEIENITDLENLRAVQKIDGAYHYEYDDGNGYQKYTISPENLSKDLKEKYEDEIQHMEEHMWNLGFTINDKYMPKHLEKAVLENAAEGAVGPHEDDIKNGTVYDYDKSSGKWYILKQNGEIEGFELNNEKIQDDAKVDIIKENMKMRNGADIEDVKFLKSNNDIHEIEIIAADGTKDTIKAKNLDANMAKKIKNGSEIDQIAFNEDQALANRKYFSDMQDVDDVLEDKQDALEAYRARMRWTIRALKGMSFVNTGAGQASFNIEAAVEQLFHMGGSPNQPQELATTKGSEAVTNYVDKRYQNNKKFMRKEISLVKRFKNRDVPVHLHDLEHSFRGMFNKDGTINKEGEKKWHKDLDEHLKKVDDDKLWQP